MPVESEVSQEVKVIKAIKVITDMINVKVVIRKVSEVLGDPIEDSLRVDDVEGTTMRISVLLSTGPGAQL